jgi:hypothetical protein
MASMELLHVFYCIVLSAFVGYALTDSEGFVILLITLSRISLLVVFFFIYLNFK